MVPPGLAFPVDRAAPHGQTAAGSRSVRDGARSVPAGYLSIAGRPLPPPGSNRGQVRGFGLGMAATPAGMVEGATAP